MTKFTVETQSYVWSSTAPHHNYLSHPVTVEIADDKSSIRIVGEYQGRTQRKSFDFTLRVDINGSGRTEIVRGRSSGRDTFCTTIAKVTPTRISLWGDNGRLQQIKIKDFIEANRFGYRIDEGDKETYVFAFPVSE